MYKKSTIIINKSGLHARPATEFAAAAAKFTSNVTIAREDDPEFDVNAKSVALLLTLALCSGDRAVICARGEDEVEAVDSLIAFIDSGLGEDE